MAMQAVDIFTPTVVANGPITVFRCVDFNGNQAATPGMKVHGVARQAADEAGDAIPIVCLGTAIVETGGVFAAGDSLVTDNQGRAVKNTGALAIAAGATAVTSAAANGANDLTGSDLPEWVFGDALAASTGAGNFVEVLLRR